MICEESGVRSLESGARKGHDSRSEVAPSGNAMG